MRVLITGGSRGIGAATAQKFKTAGYVIDTPTRDILDLSDDKSVDDFILTNKNITYDVIINNAGINEINLLENITDDELSLMIQTNLISPIRLLRGLVPNMKFAGYGKILNIASIWSRVAKSGRLSYAATKNALHGVTRILSVELAEYNILVNTVSPGYTLTELTRKNNSDNQIKDISTAIPMKRMAEPFEIAEVIYFLCSRNNSYITGQEIVVDGGFTSL